MKKVIHTLAISIIAVASIAGAFFTHLVILNLKSYNTLGVEATGDPQWLPVGISAVLVLIGYWLLKYEEPKQVH